MHTFYKLAAKSASEARKEAATHFPESDKIIFGFDKTGVCVYITSVRRRDHSHLGVATAKQNRSLRPIRFEFKVSE